ncbi:MAG TPA: DUF5655 domain-containing protein [Cyclobacteriaceae bacterium]|nr:DUF5655 domain-containing protein [Cyclobacteriaceae bacterium]
MWSCPICDQKFVCNGQTHSCRDKELSDYLAGKSEHTLGLFWHFIESYQQLGKVTVHATKSMIAIAAKTRMAYITRLGKNFMDVTFMFDQPYNDNLCFTKIAQVPGTNQYNHHFRMMTPSDINKEVKTYMKIAYKNNC